MNRNALDALKKKLDELDRRIDARERELRDRGEFADLHEAFMVDVRKRRAAIRKRMDEALDKGISWNLIETEFERDFNGLFGELLRWEERLEAETMKKRT